jgi:hypothetical protein
VRYNVIYPFCLCSFCHVGIFPRVQTIDSTLYLSLIIWVMETTMLALTGHPTSAINVSGATECLCIHLWPSLLGLLPPPSSFFLTMIYFPILTLNDYKLACRHVKAKVPSAEEAYQAAKAALDTVPLGDIDVALATLKATHESLIQLSPPSTPSVTPPWPPSPQEAAGSNSRDFSPSVFTGTPISQPSSTPPVYTAGRAGETPQDPIYFPPKEKPPPCRALSANDELSVFDIHNIFHRRWFLSSDHVLAKAISAQKDEDGKIFWVEFDPQFHAHLVKCAVALVPRPIKKVKKVMFGYILEILNREAPKAFFDLTKGPRLATKAQKEKKRLAQKRNRASRREARRAAEEAANG